MILLRSLQSRIFIASALLTVLSIGVAIYLVGVRVNREVENALQADVIATGALVDQLRTTRAETFAMMVRLVADAPKLKAAVDTNDPPTVQDVADGYQAQLRAHLFVVTNRQGRVLARVGASAQEAQEIAAHPSTRDALAGRERFDVMASRDSLLQLATVPIALGLERPDVLGALSVGFLLNDALAAELKLATGSDVAFGIDGRILASTLPPGRRGDVAPLLSALAPRTVSLGSDEFLALARPLASVGPGQPSSAAAVILRSRTDQTRFLREISTELAVTAIVGVLLATLLSFGVARTITRPLAAITRVMREVATTGDLTRKIPLGSGRRWQDEDAHLLATTFNTLTDSVHRFQREISQRERLSSLGRLSTVIAHEVRNPLMIIKASLRALRQPAPDPEVLREAVADIDDEVGRLNRVVNEVLDFARPIRFERAPTDVNALCLESAAAAQATPGVPVGLDLLPGLPLVTADAERLRIALVNLLVNARQAVEPMRPGAGRGDAAPTVTLSTRVDLHRVSILITDSGRGIPPDDLPRIFDPYFTTKRGGTGLGLPIAKNIIEGLGGTVTVTSTVGQGTEIRIDLPRQRAELASV
ncbi:MAG: ATP-binding protein [Vicinamibacterales bacterium]